MKYATMLAQKFDRVASAAANVVILLAFLTVSGGASASMKKDIVIGIGPDYGTAAHSIIALKKGYFQAEGLDVSLKTFAAGLAQVEALAAGNLDFAVPAQAPVFSLRSAGIPIVILANAATWSDAFGLVVRKDANIKSPADLVGKKIGFLKGSTAELMYSAVLKKYNVDPSRVEAVSMNPPAQLAALISKSVDGIVVWEPWVTRAVQEAGGEIRHTGTTSNFAGSVGNKAIVDWTRTVLTTLAPMIDKHPESVDAVLRAFVKAQVFIGNPANAAEVVKIFSEFQGQDAKLNAILLPKFDMNLRLDADYVEGMREPLKFLESIGRITKPVDVLEYTYTAPLMKARAEWVTIKSNMKAR